MTRSRGKGLLRRVGTHAATERNRPKNNTAGENRNEIAARWLAGRIKKSVKRPAQGHLPKRGHQRIMALVEVCTIRSASLKSQYRARSRMKNRTERFLVQGTVRCEIRQQDEVRKHRTRLVEAYSQDLESGQ